MSGRQLRDPTLVTLVKAAIERHRLPANALQIEVSEASITDAPDAAHAVLAALRSHGVRIGIEDFGTGHSSLSYLRRFNVDTLKIDRSFVLGTPHDPENSAIATAVVALGHGLRLKVVAEGVESLEQAEFLRSLGCDELQGYLLSRPMDPEQVVAWLATQPALA